MKKLHLHSNDFENDYNNKPTKIMVCHCEQCKLGKNKQKNRNYKKKIKRILNKKRRNESGNGVVHYWA